MKEETAGSIKFVRLCLPVVSCNMLPVVKENFKQYFMGSERKILKGFKNG